MAAVARWLRLTGCKGIKKILRMQVSPPFFLSHPRDYPAEPPSAGDASGGQNKCLHIRRGVVRWAEQVAAYPPRCRPPSLPPTPPSPPTVAPLRGCGQKQAHGSAWRRFLTVAPLRSCGHVVMSGSDDLQIVTFLPLLLTVFLLCRQYGDWCRMGPQEILHGRPILYLWRAHRCCLQSVINQ